MLADRSIEWSNHLSQSYFNLAWQSLEISRPWVFPGPGNFQGVGRASPPGNFQAPQTLRWCPLEISRWANILVFIALRIWSESLQFEFRNIFRPIFTIFLQINKDWSVKLIASLSKCTFTCQNMTFAMWKTGKYLIDIWFKELNNQSTWFLLKHYKGVYKTFGLINLDYIWLIRVLKTIFATLDKQWPPCDNHQIYKYMPEHVELFACKNIYHTQQQCNAMQKNWACF